MTTVPFGAWPSPLEAETVAAGRLRLSDLQTDGDDLYWIEGRPAEQGRCVIVRESAGRIEDVLPAPHSARTWVHEYGGGAFAVAGRRVVFSDAADQRLHQLRDGEVSALTAAIPGVRYADMEFDLQHSRVLCVVELHEQGAVRNLIGAVSLEDGTLRTLCEGHDFYSSPRVSPDGRWLAWLSWDNPNMPWDGTDLWVARLGADGSVSEESRVAGGADESILQPAWSADSVLHYVSDRTGWWNV